VATHHIGYQADNDLGSENSPGRMHRDRPPKDSRCKLTRAVISDPSHSGIGIEPIPIVGLIGLSTSHDRGGL